MKEATAADCTAVTLTVIRYRIHHSLQRGILFSLAEFKQN